LALRAVPAALQADLFAALPGVSARLEGGARLGGIDWRRTVAFSEELNYFPAIWLNVRGREPQGIVEPDEVPALCDRISAELTRFGDPIDGGPVVDSVLRREDVARGPYAERLPDLMLELRRPGGYAYNAVGSRGGAEPDPVRRLEPDEMSGARGTSMAGSHRTHGLCVVAGPGVPAGEHVAGTLPDAGATALALVGLGVDPRADGTPWPEVCGPDAAALDRVVPEASIPDVRAYTPAAEEEVAARLRALGYIE
jgi:predicted AlkP superfamily phosphohydrolase/phosphomutase